MSGFDLEFRKGFRGAVPGPYTAQPYETAWYQDLSYYLGKPEEWISKAIANVVSGDPKYDFGAPSHYWNQTNFASLLRDAGVDDLVQGEGKFPIVSSILGLGLAIANPLDPLNKLQVNKLTRLGRAAEAAQSAKAAGRLVEKDGRFLMETASITKRIAEVGEKSAEGKQLALGLRNAEEINTVLKKFQDKGGDVQQLRLAESLWEQARLGQRAMIGFSSPLRFDQLSIFGVHNDIMSQAPTLNIKTLDSAILRTGEAVGGALKKVASDLAFNFMDRVGMPGIRPPAMRALYEKIKKARAETYASAEDQMNELSHLLYTSDLTQDEMRQVLDMVETGPKNVNAETEGFKAVVSKAIDSLDPDKLQFNFGKAVTKEDALAHTVPGSRLSDRGHILLSPSGISKSELAEAIRSTESAVYPTIRTSNRGRLQLTDSYIVNTFVGVEPSSEITNLKGLLGIPKWELVKRDDSFSLVARRPIGSERVYAWSGEQKVNKIGVPFAPVHAHNLDLIAGQLAGKQVAVNKLNLADLLITDHGGVFIVNPESLVKAKSVEGAREVSLKSLQQFFDDAGIPLGPLRETAFLGSDQAARLALREGRKLVRARTAASLVEDVGDMVPWDLLDEAANMQAYRAILAGEQMSQVDKVSARRANNIEFWRQKIKEQRYAGKGFLDLPPVEVGRHRDGYVYIRNGRDLVAAAVLEDLPTIKVTKVPFTGEPIDFSAYTLREGKSLQDVFDYEEDMASFALNDVNKQVVSNRYKLVDAQGRRTMLQDEAINLPQGEKLFRMLTEMAGSTSGGYLASKASLAASKLASSFDKALPLVMSEIIFALKTDPVQFTKKLEELTGMDFSSLRSTKLRDYLRSEYAKLVSQADEYRAALAGRGVFTDSMLNDVRMRQQYGGIVETFDDANGAYVMTSGGRSLQELQDAVRQMPGIRGAAFDSLLPFEKIALVGSDRSQSFLTRDFVPNDGRVYHVIPKDDRFHIDDAFVKQLNSKGILYNPTKEELQKHGLDAVTKRLTDGSGGGPVWSYFVSESGQLFVSTAHDNAAQLMFDVFGEGSVYAREFGVIAKEKIIVNNPFGARFRELGKPEVKQMTVRIKELARKFEQAGFDPDTLLDIPAPGIDLHVFNKMYGSGNTLKSIQQKGWKLNLDELSEGMLLDYQLIAPSAVVSVQRPRFGDERMQGLVDWINQTNDQLIKQELTDKLPLNQLYPYMPHIATQEGMKAFAALNKAAEAEIQSLVPKARHVEFFLKKRLFTDYKIGELNDLVQTLRKGKAEGLTQEQLYERVLERLKREQDFKTFDALATEMNKVNPMMDVHFLHQNPYYIEGKRIRASVQARAAQKVVETMEQGGAALVLSPTQFDLMKKGQAWFQAKEAAATKLTEKIDSLVAEQQALVVDPGSKLSNRAQDVAEELDRLRTARGELRMKIDDAHKELAEVKGPLARDVNFINRAEVYVPGEAISKLIDQGLITERELIDQVGNELVRIPVKKYEDHLAKDGTKIVFFTDEAQVVADQFFRATRKGAGGAAEYILNAWDFTQDMWRRWTLFPVPAYHGRQLIGNLFMGYLGGIDMASYKEAFDALNTVSKFRRGATNIFDAMLGRSKAGSITLDEVQKMFGNHMVTDIYGNQASMLDLYSEWIKNTGGASSGLVFNEFSKFTGGVKQSSDFVAKVVSTGGVPSSEMAGSIWLDNKLLRGGQSLMMASENRFRFAAFIDGWKKSGSFDKAALNMKKIYYDYTDMNMFERSVLRRVFPFYAWSRHNIPRMIETLFTDPIKHYRIGRFVHAMERGASDDQPISQQDLPDWAWSRYAVVIGKDSNKNWIIKTTDGTFPSTDAFKLLSNPTDMLSDGLTPFMKVPVEVIRNKQLGSKQPIQYVDGQPANSWTLSKLGFSAGVTTEGPLGPLNLLLNEHLFRSGLRVGNVATRVFDWALDDRNYRREKPSFTTAIMDLLIGRSFSVDPMKARVDLYRDWNSNKAKFERFLEYANDRGDVEAVKHGQNMLHYLELNKPIR